MDDNTSSSTSSAGGAVRWEQVRATLAGRPLPIDMALSLLGSIADRLREDHLRGRASGFDPAALTIVGDGVGTVGDPDALPGDGGYVAPELRGRSTPTPAGDAFAYAVFAYELLIGGSPHDAPDVQQMTTQHPALPAYVADAFARALGDQPAARPLPRSLFASFGSVPADGWPIVAPATVPVATPASDVAAVTVAEPASQDAPTETPPPADLLDPTGERSAVPDFEPLTEFIPSSGHPTGGRWVRASSRRGRRAKRASRARRGNRSATQSATEQAPELPADGPSQAAPPVEATAAPMPAPPARREPDGFDLPEAFRNPPASRWTPERIQQVVLVAVILVLILAGILYALSRDGEAEYDPALQGQGASLSITQPAPSAR